MKVMICWGGWMLTNFAAFTGGADDRNRRGLHLYRYGKKACFSAGNPKNRWDEWHRIV